jgi:hypothetical protein
MVKGKGSRIGERRHTFRLPIGPRRVHEVAPNLGDLSSGKPQELRIWPLCNCLVEYSVGPSVFSVMIEGDRKVRTQGAPG